MKQLMAMHAADYRARSRPGSEQQQTMPGDMLLEYREHSPLIDCGEMKEAVPRDDRVKPAPERH